MTKYNVTAALTVTKNNADGTPSPFVGGPHSWSGLAYGQLRKIEKLMGDVVGKCVALGDGPVDRHAAVGADSYDVTVTLTVDQTDDNGGFSRRSSDTAHTWHGISYPALLEIQKVQEYATSALFQMGRDEAKA